MWENFLLKWSTVQADLCRMLFIHKGKGSFSQLSQVCKVTRDKLNFSSRDLIYSAPDQIHSKFKSTLFLIKGKCLGKKRGYMNPLLETLHSSLCSLPTLLQFPRWSDADFTPYFHFHPASLLGKPLFSGFINRASTLHLRNLLCNTPSSKLIHPPWSVPSIPSPTD